MSITLLNKLTGQEWHFYSAAGLTALGADVDGIQLATFNDFSPGLYSVINDGAEDVQVVLWGQTYTVESNSKWDFMAHQDVASISPLLARTADERYRGEPISSSSPATSEASTASGTDTTTGGADSTPAASTTAPNP